jgi:hypothetical protein
MKGPGRDDCTLCHPQGWSEVMAREVLENCHKTISASYVALGQSMGQTLLPQPPANMLVRSSGRATHAQAASVLCFTDALPRAPNDAHAAPNRRSLIARPRTRTAFTC